ncbi:hypothetical protein NHX12_012493 [Muraenolepis orangiensis]|uniref:SEFIR domain-containing protein n=1 Tax=Muraenolepis orangiensis TaxID=630683 RepID=A0A9Q0I427_9TELE|nr:hypothetical protein NHX12_012493 [Muraenolepis orangiensis]
MGGVWRVADGPRLFKEVNCHRKDTLPPSSVNAAPSLLGNLSVEVKGDLRLHIQWAVTVDVKAYRSHISGSGYFRKLPISTQTPVSVLLVYPAECPAFQKTVVALAEFLQEHGGCSVAVDFWQQGKIAELGPMRWAAGQAKAADRVLVVCPQPISCRSNHSFLGPSIPASANDLYPLVLNMVASHAKDPSELAMFWAVQLGKGERPRSLPGEMTACKFFSLTKDLDKLCRSLHNKRQDSSIPQRPEMLYNKKSTMKLQDAIGQLAVHRSSITVEQERLNSVAIIV